ncbi:hypothetical protein [Streptomyces sp. NPDC059278]|uniref:hypothetical protein n=1 Tax=Streptomyces sp. NPDC059278 TaxID=3346801 RepID=UPI003695F986
MGALPGQRAAQRPIRAAVAAQRAIGRAVAASGGTAGRLVMNVGGRWVEQVIDGQGQEHLVPYDFKEGNDGW